MKFLPALALVLLCAGCDSFQAQRKTPPASATSHSHFVVYSSAGETFLLDSDTGKVWRYDAKEKAFVEIPVTSKIIRYDAKGNRVEPDPKDPLGILK
jgi:hypothetical protein